MISQWEDEFFQLGQFWLSNNNLYSSRTQSKADMTLLNSQVKLNLPNLATKCIPISIFLSTQKAPPKKKKKVSILLFFSSAKISQQPNSSLKNTYLSIVSLLASDTPNEAFTGECTVAHDNEPSVCHLAQTFALESQGLAYQFQRLATLRKIRAWLIVIIIINICSVVGVWLGLLRVFSERGSNRSHSGWETELSKRWLPRA